MAKFNWKNSQASGSGGGGSGESNTSSSVGSGVSIVLPKSGVNLPFKSFTAGSNITLTPSANEIEISASGGASGEANTASSVGTGKSLVLPKSGVNIPFKTLTEGTNVTLTASANEISIQAIDPQVATNTSAITAKADQSSLNTTNTNVSNNTSAIAAKADQSALDTTNTNVSSNTSAIATKANQSDLNTTNTNVTSNASNIASNTTAIGTKAAQTSLDATNTSVTANATAIAGKQAAHTLGTVASSGASQTLDFAVNDSFKVTLTDNCTFTLSTPLAGNSYVIVLIQDGTGSRTVTWPATVKFQGGTAPTLTTDANAVDVITLFWDGTQYLANVGKDFS